MTTSSLTNEFNIFTKCQREVIEAIKSGDRENIQLGMEEIELMGEHTSWPRLRGAIANFLRLHAEHIPTREARDTLTLKALRLEIEDATEAPGAMSARNAMVTRVNLGSVESIWLRTKDLSTREDAAALLCKYAAYAKLYNFNA